LRYSGARVVVEEQRCFQGHSPDNNQRPDISGHGIPGYGNRKVIFDVSLATPIPLNSVGHNTLTLDQAAVPRRAAMNRFKEKNRKYLSVARANNLEFLPLIFEISGAMHEKSFDFFTLVAKNVSERKKINPTIMLRYFMKSVSLCIQRNVAEAINEKATTIVGGYSVSEPAYEDSDDFIRESEYLVV
jgi:hypothetical protein